MSEQEVISSKKIVQKYSFTIYLKKFVKDYSRMIRGHFKSNDHLGYTTRFNILSFSISRDYLRFIPLSVNDFQKLTFWQRLAVFTYSLLYSVIFTSVSLLLLIYLATGTAQMDIQGEGMKFIAEYALNIVFIMIYTAWGLLELSRFFWIIRHFFQKDWVEYNKRLTSQYGKAADFDNVELNGFIKGMLQVIYYILWILLQVGAVALVITTLDTLTIYGAFDKFFAP